MEETRPKPNLSVAEFKECVEAIESLAEYYVEYPTRWARKHGGKLPTTVEENWHIINMFLYRGSQLWDIATLLKKDLQIYAAEMDWSEE